jgi:hypothetical protein
VLIVDFNMLIPPKRIEVRIFLAWIVISAPLATPDKIVARDKSLQRQAVCGPLRQLTAGKI